jgi:hypothetical protein
MNQQLQSTPLSPVDRSDELDFIGLWKVLIEYKLLIIVFTTLTTLGATYYASTLPAIYRAEVLMISADGSGGGISLSNRLGSITEMVGLSGGNKNTNSLSAESLARLKTRSFLINHIKEKSLKPILFANQWNKSEKQWIGKEPSDRDSAELLKSMIEAGSHPRSKAGLMSLIIRMKNPANPNQIAGIANDLVVSMNYHAKRRAIVEARNSISFLEKELQTTSIINAQTILYNLIEQQTSKIMMANVRDEFVFKVIDPAVVPRRAEAKRTSMIILIGMMLGIFFGTFLAIGINYFKGSSLKITVESRA